MTRRWSFTLLALLLAAFSASPVAGQQSSPAPDNTNLQALVVPYSASPALKAIDAVTSGPGAGEGEARVRVLHASPDAPAVDVYVEGALALSNLAFEEFSGYLAVAPGTYNVRVTAAGDPGAVVIEADLVLAAGTDYTVAAMNVLASIEPVVFEDDNTAPAAGQAHVRVVHGSPDAPIVDVYANGGLVLSNVPFKAASGYLPVPAGTYNFQVTPAGQPGAVVIDVTLDLAEGTIHTVVATGRVSELGNARVRVLHASPDAPAVDVYVNDGLVLSNVPFGAISDYLTVPAGMYNVKVTAAGDPGVVVIDADVNVAGATDYTVAATGFLAEIMPVIYVDDNARPAASLASVRVVHLSPNGPPVDVNLLSGGTLVADLAFREAAGPLPISEGSYDLYVAPAGGTRPVLSLPDTMLTSGDILTVFAIGTWPAPLAVSVTDLTAAQEPAAPGAWWLAALPLALIAGLFVLRRRGTAR